MKRYVWSSHPDALLLEWDLLLELYDRGRILSLLPCLVGDVTTHGATSARDRVLARLGIDSLDEGHLVKRVREIFHFADTDNSGSIDRAELETAFRRFGLDVTPAELATLADRADGDGDDGIDLFEFEDLVRFFLESKCGMSFRDPGPVAPRRRASVPDAADAADAAAAAGEARFTRFAESGAVPELPPVVMSQVRLEQTQLSAFRRFFSLEANICP